MSLERSPLDKAIKSIKPFKKQKCQKYQRLTHFFKTQFYIHNKIIIEKSVNRRDFFIDEKNLQKLGLLGELISAYLYYMIILSFQRQFMVLQLVKQWLTVVNSVLIVDSNHLIAVKQCLRIFFSQKLCAVGKFSFRESQKKQRSIEKAEI